MKPSATVPGKFRLRVRAPMPPLLPRAATRSRVLPRVRPPAGARKRKMMSSSTTEPGSSAPISAPFTAAVVTVSDSCARGERADLSGPAVAEVLAARGFRIVAKETVQDDGMQIQNILVHLALQARFIVTTGGTG